MDDIFAAKGTYREWKFCAIMIFLSWFNVGTISIAKKLRSSLST